MDCWLNACVAGVQAGSSLMYGYQLDYNRWLANTAHKYGMAAALKVSDSSIPFSPLPPPPPPLPRPPAFYLCVCVFFPSLYPPIVPSVCGRLAGGVLPHLWIPTGLQ